MKMSRFAWFAAVIVTCFFVVSLTSDARSYERPGYTKDEAGGNARFIIWREADFGTFIYLRVYVDGIPVTLLGQGVGYEAVIRPGEHLISISTTPSPYG